MLEETQIEIVERTIGEKEIGEASSTRWITVGRDQIEALAEAIEQTETSTVHSAHYALSRYTVRVASMQAIPCSAAGAGTRSRERPATATVHDDIL